MKTWELNRCLEESIKLMEKYKRTQTPIPKSWVEFDVEKGHYWRTISGKKVMFNKGGKMMNPPKWTAGSELDKDPGDSKGKSGMWEGPISKKQQKQLDKMNNQLNEKLGKGHGFAAGLDKGGDLVIVNDKVEEAAEQDDKVDSTKLPAKVKKEGKTWNLFATLVALADAYSGLLLQAGKSLSAVLGKAIRNLNSALEDWQK